MGSNGLPEDLVHNFCEFPVYHVAGGHTAIQIHALWLPISLSLTRCCKLSIPEGPGASGRLGTGLHVQVAGLILQNSENRVPRPAIAQLIIMLLISIQFP